MYKFSKIIIASTVLAVLFACSTKDLVGVAQPVDGDGNPYKTIVIGEQEWFAENLRTTKLNNGKPIQELQISGDGSSYYWYNNDPANSEIYGALYSWEVVSNKKLCPAGWRIPSKDDWEELENYLQGKGLNVAKAVSSRNGWYSNDIVGAVGNQQEKNNSSGFNALPAGSYRARDNKFRLKGSSAMFWSSTAFNRYIFSIFINSARDSVGHPRLIQTGAHSVRCIKVRPLSL